MQGRSWLRHCATSRKVAGSIPNGFIGNFHWHNLSGRTMGPGIDSASNINEYQEYFLLLKAAGALGWQPYNLHVPIILKSGKLNLLEASGPAQPCTGIALPFTRGADKSLARPTSRCRRTDSIVSLESGVYSCAELQVFPCYRDWKETCQVTRAISTTSRRELSSFFFHAMQGAEGNSRHSDRNIRRTCTIVCHRQKLGDPV